MPKRSFALEEGGKKRLELSWSGFWSNFTVSVDGMPVAGLQKGQSIKEGHEFSLPDGSVLWVQLKQGFAASYLEVLRNGHPLPGSDTNPRSILNTASGIIYVFCGVNLLAGIIGFFFDVPLLQENGIGFYNIILGFIYLPLAYYIREGSSIALLLAVVICLIDGVASIIFPLMVKGNPSFGAIAFRFFVLIFLFRGFSAITTLKESGEL